MCGFSCDSCNRRCGHRCHSRNALFRLCRLCLELLSRHLLKDGLQLRGRLALLALGSSLLLRTLR